MAGAARNTALPTKTTEVDTELSKEATWESSTTSAAKRHSAQMTCSAHGARGPMTKGEFLRALLRASHEPNELDNKLDFLKLSAFRSAWTPRSPCRPDTLHNLIKLQRRSPPRPPLLSLPPRPLPSPPPRPLLSPPPSPQPLPPPHRLQRRRRTCRARCARASAWQPPPRAPRSAASAPRSATSQRPRMQDQPSSHATVRLPQHACGLPCRSTLGHCPATDPFLMLLRKVSLGARQEQSCSQSCRNSSCSLLCHHFCHIAFDTLRCQSLWRGASTTPFAASRAAEPHKGRRFRRARTKAGHLYNHVHAGKDRGGHGSSCDARQWSSCDARQWSSCDARQWSSCDARQWSSCDARQWSSCDARRRRPLDHAGRAGIVSCILRER
eukprot:6212205-Pleurochrysis_carterae.AAC.1